MSFELAANIGIKNMRKLTIGESVSILIGLLGMAFGYYQNLETVKLRELHRAQAWRLYHTVDLAGGSTQALAATYKKKYADNLDGEFLYDLGRAHSRSGQTLYETISLLQQSEPEFNCTSLEHWIEIGKVPMGHREEFVELIVKDSDCESVSKSMQPTAGASTD